MKSWIFTMVLVTVLFSCSNEEITVDFSGTYSGKLKCAGELASDNGETIQLTLKKITSNTYTLDLGDDLTFTCSQEGDALIINRQTINEDAEFDVVTLEGKIVKSTSTQYIFDFIHNVDDEGESSCEVVLTKD